MRAGIQACAVESRGAGFAGAHAVNFGHWIDEDLAVADLTVGAGARHGQNRLEGELLVFRLHADFQEHLRHKAGVELWPAVAFAVAALFAKAFALDRGGAEDSFFDEGSFDGVESIGLDDGFDHDHKIPPSAIIAIQGLMGC